VSLRVFAAYRVSWAVACLERLSFDDAIGSVFWGRIHGAILGYEQNLINQSRSPETPNLAKTNQVSPRTPEPYESALDDRVNALEQFKPETTQEIPPTPTSAAFAVTAAPTDSVGPVPLDEPLEPDFAQLSADSVDLHRPELLEGSVERSHSVRRPLLIVGVGVVFAFVGWYLLGAGRSVHRVPAATAESAASAPAAAQTETLAGPEPTQTPQTEPVPPSSGARLDSTAPPVRSAPSGAPVSVDDQPLETAGTLGALSVDSHPAGANLYIDGQLVGKTPASLQKISAGTHVVRLELDAHRGWSSSVRVAPGGRNRVTASLEEENQPRF
jgi:hypothetical protein